MRVTDTSYSAIMEYTPLAPPESGGILGQRSGVVCKVFFDPMEGETGRAVYTPSVELLNSVIAEWKQEEIAFCGIFHTHPTGQRKLSEADVKYITTIMAAMPKGIDQLYFPLVFPGEEMIGYTAYIVNNSVVIEPDEIIIVKENGQ